MPRPDAEKYELTDAEKRDLVKLIKLSKDKQGVITRDVLTKKWTDWVDYWAVDFDYESRKEIKEREPHLRQSGPLYHCSEGDRYFWQRHNDPGAGECGLIYWDCYG